jgi:hypothetical protein
MNRGLRIAHCGLTEGQRASRHSFHLDDGHACEIENSNAFINQRTLASITNPQSAIRNPQSSRPQSHREDRR